MRVTVRNLKFFENDFYKSNFVFQNVLINTLSFEINLLEQEGSLS